MLRRFHFGSKVLALAATVLLAACGGSGSTPSGGGPVDPPIPPNPDLQPPTVEVDEPTHPTALIPGDAIHVVFRADDNVGATVEIVLDADGDPTSTGDQVSLWSGDDQDGVTQTVEVETEGLPTGPWVLFVIADDGTNDPVAAGEPSSTGVVAYPARAGLLGPRRNAYGVTGTSVVFAVGEAEQGNTDLNGDGDAGDGVVSQIDASTGVEIPTGMTTDIRTIGLTTWTRVLSNEAGGIAWERRESDEGRSLNADGDLQDTMVAFTAPLSNIEPTANLIGGATLTDVGYPLYRVLTYLEADEGTDLNNDGDIVDTVLSVLDYETNTFAQVFVPTPRAGARIVGQGINLGWSVDERVQGLGNRGIDLNGDGDTNDTLFHSADLVDFLLHLHPVDVDSSAGYSVAEEDPITHYYADEAAAGYGSLNGDLDSTDFVPCTSFAGAFSFPQSVSPPSPMNGGPGAPTSFCYGSLCIYTAAEEGLGDRNGDGDITDTQVLLWTLMPQGSANGNDLTPGIGTLTSLALDGGSAAQVGPGWISMAVSEVANGQDLNGDGDSVDVVLMLVDITGDKPVVYSVGLAPLGAGGLLPVGATTIPQTGVGGDVGMVFQVIETANGDLNGDGDLSDTLLYYVAYNAPTTPIQLANTGGLHVGFADDCIAITAHETLTMQDFNGDGDTSDVLFRVVDTSGDVIESGRYSLPDSVPVTDDGTVFCFLRSELDEGRDLNDDGDTVDPIMGIWLRP